MANVFEHVEMLGAEALMHLEDSLVIANTCSKDLTSDFTVKPNGYSVGDVINFKTRPAYEAKEFAGAIEIQSVRESKRPMTIEKHFDVSVELTAKELALEFDGFVEQVIQPAAYSLSEKVDRYIGGKILQAAGMAVDTTILSTAASMANARKDANYQQLMPGNRFSVVSDTLEARLLGADYFNTASVRGGDAEQTFREASMGRAMGFEWLSSLNFPDDTHTCGNGTSFTDNGGGTNNLVGTKILTIDALTGAFTEGDRIRISGVRRPLVVASDVAANATAVPLVDPIAEIIPDNAAVTVVGSGQTATVLGAMFDSAALGTAFPILDLPGDKVAASVGNNGISIRIVKGYSIESKKTTLSLDVLVGSFALDPRRITLLADVA